MLGELGQLALCFALALSLVMAIAGLLGAKADSPNAELARRIALECGRNLRRALLMFEAVYAQK